MDSRRQLECEGRRMFDYLVGGVPSPYVLDWYIAARETHPERFEPRGAWDRTLERAAASRVIPLRWVDGCCAIFAPASAVRRRLILMAAILESFPGTYRAFEVPDAPSPIRFAIGATPRVVASALAFTAGTAVFSLLYLTTLLRKKSSF